MLTKILMHGVERPPTPKEGDLYKEVTISGKTFRLLYGYYESIERESPFNDPIPIYPDFEKEPHYTAEGIPIVTAMQNVCSLYKGKAMKTAVALIVYFSKKAKSCLAFAIAQKQTV